MKLRMVELLKTLRQIYGEEQFVELIDAAVKRWHQECAPEIAKEDDFLDHYRARGKYRENLKVREKYVGNLYKLAESLERLRLPAGAICPLDHQPPPWSNWPDDSVVVILMGERHAEFPNAARHVSQRAVDVRDVQAQSRLLMFLLADLHLRAQIKIIHKPCDWDQKAAAKELAELTKRKNVRAIIGIGSSMVNPFAEPIAQRIFKQPDDVPFKFHWPNPSSSMPNFLSISTACGTGEAGIRRRGGSLTIRADYPRATDDEIYQRVNEPDAPKHFPDAGLLIMDCSNSPILVLLAGHGGIGTIATVLALADKYQIARRLDQSRERHEHAVGWNRLCEVIVARQTKPTTAAIDDMELDDKQDDGWSFAWE